YIVRWFCPRPRRRRERPLRSVALPSRCRAIPQSGAGPCETSAANPARLIAAFRFPSRESYPANLRRAIGRSHKRLDRVSLYRIARDGFGGATLRGAASSGLLIDKSKRNQRRSIDRARHRQVILHLVILNRRSRYRAEHAINCFTEISELLQCVLHVGDNLVRWQTIITIGRPIVSVVRIIRIVTVSRIPISQVPRVKAAAD